MAEEKDDDVLAGEHAGDGEGAWVDISIPQVVHDQLTAWGERVGLTAEGYAKLLLFQAMHPLLAAEAGDVKRATSPQDAFDPGARSREMWGKQLGRYRNAEDLAPAPVVVDEAAGWRAYASADFDWGDEAPPAHPYATVDRSGAMTVSERPPKAAEAT